MSKDEIGLVVDNYMKRIAKLLRESFETEDLLEDLKSHIYEAYNEKVQKNPDDDRQRLIIEVLETLGTPEEIAEEYSKDQIEEEEKKGTVDKWIYYAMRLMLAILVVVLASWIASVITEGAVDFMSAVIVLLAFAVIEWVIRTQQTKDA